MQNPGEAYEVCIICRVILLVPCIHWILYSLAQELGSRERRKVYHIHGQWEGNVILREKKAGEGDRGLQLGRLGIPLPLSKARPRLPLDPVSQRTVTVRRVV